MILKISYEFGYTEEYILDKGLDWILETAQWIQKEDAIEKKYQVDTVWMYHTPGGKGVNKFNQNIKRLSKQLGNIIKNVKEDLPDGVMVIVDD